MALFYSYVGIPEGIVGLKWEIFYKSWGNTMGFSYGNYKGDI